MMHYLQTAGWCWSLMRLISYNEIIPVLMSLNRCLITTNLLIPLGQLMHNIHISRNDRVIIKHSLMRCCAQAKVSIWLSSAFLDRQTVSGAFPGSSALQSSIWTVLHLPSSWLLKKNSSDILSRRAVLAL